MPESSHVFFDMIASKLGEAERIPGVPGKVFAACTKRTLASLEDSEEVRVVHIPSGLLFCTFYDFKQACDTIRRWWRSLSGSQRDFLCKLKYNDVVKAMWKDAPVKRPDFMGPYCCFITPDKPPNTNKKMASQVED